MATYSAADPIRRPSAPQTRSPALNLLVPGSTTSPTRSTPTRFGNRLPSSRRSRPVRTVASPPFTETALTRTSTSPGPGCGTGPVVTDRTSGGPYRSKVTSRIDVGVIELGDIEVGDTVHF